MTRTVEKLNRRCRMLEQELHLAGIGTYRYALDGTLLEIDKGALQALGFKADDDPARYLRRNLYAILEGAGAPLELQEEVRRVRPVRNFVYKMKPRQESEHWVLHDAYQTTDEETGRDCIQVIVKDITGLKHTEEALRKERDLTAALFNTIGALVVVLDTQGRIVRFNRACEIATGYSANEVIGRALWDFLIIPEEIEAVSNIFRELKSGSFPNSHENYWVSKDGSRRYIAWTNTTLLDNNGHVEYVVGTGIDITERREFETALRESEELFREVFEFAHDLIFTVDAETLQIITINEAVTEILQYQPAELLGQPFHVFVNTEDIPTAEEYLVRSLEGTPTTVEVWCRRKDGTPVLLEFRIRAMSGGVINVIAYDVTERRRESEAARRLSVLLQERVREKTMNLEEANRHLREMQAQFVQTEKLASLGRLVAGLSHEINNPLSVISNNLVVIRRDFQALVEIYELYQQIVGEHDAAQRMRLLEEARRLVERENVEYVVASLDRIFSRSIESSERIRKIVRDMRDFSRLGEAQWKEANLNEAVETTIRVLTHEIKSKEIKLVRNYGALPEMYCMPGRLNQVFFNILVNAIEAVPHGGRIVISTWSHERGVKIAITNNGLVIPREDMDKLFDPFFTTKARGTGLGLSICYNIVAEHEGRIEVESREDYGTTFTIILPFLTERPEHPTMLVPPLRPS